MGVLVVVGVEVLVAVAAGAITPGWKFRTVRGRYTQNTSGSSQFSTWLWARPDNVTPKVRIQIVIMIKGKDAKITSR